MKYFFLALILGLASPSRATPASEQSRFSLVFSEDPTRSPITAVFRDGREAQLLVRRAGLLRTPIELSLTETLCPTLMTPTKCVLELPFESLSADFFWTKNTDPRRLGKKVVRKIATVEVGLTYIFGSYTLSIEDKQRLGFTVIPEKATFTCDDYRWMTGELQSQPPAQALIFSWGSELNFPNADTGANENMTFNGAQQLRMSLKTKAVYEIDSAQFFSRFPTPALATNGPVTLVTADAHQNYCPSTFSSDLGPTLSLLDKSRRRLESAMPAPGPVPPDLLRQMTKDLKDFSAVLEQGEEYLGLVE